MVENSSAKAEEDFALGNRKSELSWAEIKKNGATKAYKSHCNYLSILREKARSSQIHIKEWTRTLDDSPNRTYKGECDFLLRWSRERVPYHVHQG